MSKLLTLSLPESPELPPDFSSLADPLLLDELPFEELLLFFPETTPNVTYEVATLLSRPSGF